MSSLEYLLSKELASKLGAEQLSYFDDFISGTKQLIELRDDAELLDCITRSAISAMHGLHAMDPDVLPQAATIPSMVDVSRGVSEGRGAPAQN
jgi:hypothetical protein